MTFCPPIRALLKETWPQRSPPVRLLLPLLRRRLCLRFLPVLSRTAFPPSTSDSHPPSLLFCRLPSSVLVANVAVLPTPVAWVFPWLCCPTPSSQPRPDTPTSLVPSLSPSLRPILVLFLASLPLMLVRLPHLRALRGEFGGQLLDPRYGNPFFPDYLLVSSQAPPPTVLHHHSPLQPCTTHGPVLPSTTHAPP